MMKQIKILKIVFFLFAPAALGQVVSTGDIQVKLTIMEKGTGIPLAKSEVALNGEKLVTDPKGQVSLHWQPLQTGSLEIVRHGYKSETVVLTKLPESGDYEIYLYPSVSSDDEVVILGERRASVSKKTISIEEATRVAPNGDPAQVVKLLPGVQSRNNGGEVVVRGSGPRDSRYFIDDLEVPLVFHNFGNLSIIPGDMLEAVDFESGGFGPEYGDATGGVIVLRTRKEIPDRAKTEIVTNVPFYAGAMNITPLSDNSMIMAGYRRSYVDYFIKLFQQQQNSGADNSTVIAPYFSDGQAIYLKKDETGYSKWTLLGAYDGLKASGSSGRGNSENGRTDINILTGFANFGYERETRLSDGWRVNYTPQVFYFKQTNNFSGSTDETATIRARVPMEFTKRLEKNEYMYFGVDPSYTRTDTNIYEVQRRPDDPTFDPESATKELIVDTQYYSSLAGWGDYDFGLGKAIVSPGARMFYNSQMQKTSADPRLRMRYLIDNEQIIKMAVGQYSESPTAIQASRSRGNPGLNYIVSNHYVLGIESKWNPQWTTEFQVFYKTARDMINSDATERYVNGRQMRSRGAEVFIRKNMTGQAFGWISYTYSKTEERKNTTLSFSPAQYDQTHVLTVVGDYKLTGTLDIAGRYYFHSGNTYSTISNAVFNADHDVYQPRPTDADQNAGRTPNFNALTVYVNKDLLFDTWKLALKVGMESFWLKPQVAMVRYNYDYTAPEEVTSLTSIPFIEVRGEF